MNVTAKSIMVRVSERLTDQEPDYEFELYTETTVLSAFNWALSAISQVRPDLFTQQKTLPIAHGATHTVAGCDHITSITGVIVDGELDTTFTPMSASNRFLRRRQVCTEKYRAVHVGLSGLNNVSLHPPVPDDVDVSLLVMCAYTPQADSVDAMVDIPVRLHSVVEELMLYYLYNIDAESVPNRDRAGAHYNVAMALLGVQAK